MSADTEAEKLYAAIEESARLVGAPCSREKVRPVLTAFGGSFENAMVVFSVLTGKHHAGQLDYCFTISPDTGDPYARAVASGLTAATDHPVASLLADIHAQGWEITEHFTDCSAVAGFKKIYAHFPRDLQKPAALAALPSMPPAVAHNLGLFARHGLDEVAMTGIDYRSRTVSLYFQFTENNSPPPAALASLLRETGLPAASGPMLEFARTAFRANVTLGWDSPDIARVAFAPPLGPGLDLAAIPAPVEAPLARFAATAPRTYTGDRMNLFAVKWLPTGEFLEICSYYRLPAAYEPVRLMQTRTPHP
ncbi:aromatic prenyltransferase [Streptomyces sp. NBC_01478]|uniref:aromatic prenyltransferase n=1 Tax=Streptomyces sp. NBC_01478 TaxID=2903882 RepID=UPI002E35E835|nr:aromatic prenyltransferase [Streptomyces sp. NBC_01478]